MPTSGVVVLTTNRDQIIRLSLKLIGRLGEAEQPTAEEVNDCAFILNAMAKQWVSKTDFAPGLKLWKRRRGTLFLSSTTGVYSLGPSGDHWTEQDYKRQLTATSAASDTTLDVGSIANASASDNIGVVLDDNTIHWTTISGAPSGTTITLASGIPTGKNASSGNWVFNYTAKAARPVALETIVLREVEDTDVPVSFMTLQQYQELPNKADPDTIGSVTSAYYESQLTNGTLYTDIGGADDVTDRLHIVWMEPIENFDAAADEPDFPSHWYLALAWGLGKQVAPMFSAVWTQEMESNFATALGMAREQDPETTHGYFQPKGE